MTVRRQRHGEGHTLTESHPSMYAIGNVPRTGLRDWEIDFRRISDGLPYFIPQIFGSPARYPRAEQLFFEGAEVFVDYPGFHFITITPLAEQVEELRELIMAHDDHFHLMGRFSWNIGKYQQDVTCQGVRVGFREMEHLLCLKIKFDTVHSVEA